MKISLPTWLFGLILITSVAVNAQCPSGSITNTAGTYNAGDKVCITSNFSGAITLNSGAIMTVISGGNYTGTLVMNAGSILNVQSGGRVAPANFNTFAGTINNNLGTIVMPNASIAAGASINNNGGLSWPSGWTQNAAITLTNTACGFMSFSSGMTLGNNASIINNGRMNFLGTLTMHSGTSLTNRGLMYVTGGLTSSGLIYNYNKAVFKSSGTLNSGDSIINLGWMVFAGTVTNDRPIRNEGLLQNGGGWTNNANGTMLVNNSNAQFRVGGTLNNNAAMQGNGSLYVNGSANNNSTISGFSATQRLRVNKVLNPASAPNTTYNAALVAMDTNSYTAPMAQPAVCSPVLPKAVSGLQIAYQHGTASLRWKGYGEAADYFVEFSTDGVKYVTLGSANNFQFTHTTTATGNLYYRIREVAANGFTLYSNTVAVKTVTNDGATHVFPNPFTNNLQVNIFLNKSDVVEVALFNAGGQLLVSQRNTAPAGSNAISVSGLSALTPGVYFARIKTGDKTVYSKLMK